VKLTDSRILIRADTTPDVFKLEEVTIEINEIIKGQYFYHEKLLSETIKTFGYDGHSHILIMMRGSIKKGQRQKYIKIYDKENDRVMWNGKVNNTELIGRLKSLFYELIDGHLYYNNKVIKIRYDLLQKNNIKELNEEEVFDYFENVFDLDSGD
jgi:hypothetical protein